MLNIRTKFHESRTCAFRELTIHNERDESMNELTNQPTNQVGGGAV